MPAIREGHPALRFLTIPVFLGLLAFLAWLPGCGSGNDLAFPTEFQAVFLDNGQVFFGKIGDVGAQYLSLNDVYYVQRQVEPDKKVTKNLLMRLGSEWHGPDFMRINSRHIVLIEPVASNSRVARLIREAKTAPAPAPASTTQPPAAAPAESPHKVEKKTSPVRK